MQLVATGSMSWMTVASPTGEGVTVRLSKRGGKRIADWLRAWSGSSDKIRVPELASPGDLLERYGCTARTLRQWRRHETFPEPIAELASGPVWAVEQVDAWHGTRPKRGRPPKATS